MPDLTIDDLDTPAVVADVEIVEANIGALQDYCDAHGFDNRPHVKTHKSTALARMQIDAGAVGICCQTVGEAEVMAGAGIDNILIPCPIVGDSKVRRLAALAERAKLSVAVDSADVATGISRAASSQSPIGLLVEIQSHAYPRTGVAGSSEVLALAQRISNLRNVHFKGLMVFPTTHEDVGRLNEARDLLQRDGLDVEVMSGGGTPEYPASHETPGLTEIRTGTYVFHDLRTVGMGTARMDDCALRVVTTVASRPSSDRAILDVGSKTLTNDPDESGRRSTFGYVVEYPDAELNLLSEEHALVDLSRRGPTPKLGERLSIIPNHCSGVVSMVDEIVQIRGGLVVGRWPVEARGRTD